MKRPHIRAMALVGLLALLVAALPFGLALAASEMMTMAWKNGATA